MTLFKIKNLFTLIILSASLIYCKKDESSPLTDKKNNPTTTISSSDKEEYNKQIVEDEKPKVPDVVIPRKDFGF